MNSRKGSKTGKINEETFSSEGTIKYYAKHNILTSVETTIASKYLNQNQKILEVGCGTGRVSGVLRKEFNFNVYSTDIVKEMLNTGIEIGNLEAEKTFHADAGKHIPADDASFDVVWFTFNGIDFLYPLENRKKFLEEAKRVLKNGGYLIISSHTKSIYYNFKSKYRLYVLLINIFRRRYWKESYMFAPHKGQGWLLYYCADTENNIRLIEKQGFEIIDVVSKYVPNGTIQNLNKVNRLDPYPHYVFRRI